MSNSNKFTIDSSQRAPIKMWTAGVPVEDSAMQQLRNVASLPFVHRMLPAPAGGAASEYPTGQRAVPR